jgi:molybdate transport system permease protein
VPPADLLHALGSDVARDALIVSLKTSAIAHAAVLLFGTPAAWVLARKRFRGAGLVLALVELPLVLPPASRASRCSPRSAAPGCSATSSTRWGPDPVHADGRSSSRSRSSRARSTSAVRSRRSRPSTGRCSTRLARWARRRACVRACRPAARRGGLGAASALALARGLGEFGATIIFAGSLQGVTQTLPLAIYAQFDQDFDTALAISALFIVVGAVLLVALKLYPWFRFVSISRSRFAPST